MGTTSYLEGAGSAGSAPKKESAWLTTIADSAALTWRVSKSTTSNPACLRPAYSQCDSGPASNPIRVTGKPNPLKNVARTQGSLAIFASLVILPAASTTHTLDCSNDMSIPA